MQLSDYLFYWGLLLSIILGLGWGSFATMATYRLPRGKPWIGDCPKCLVCGHKLSIIDYFSILSFFVWRGKCRYCKTQFEDNLPYFLTELFITLGIALCYIIYGFSEQFVLISGILIASVILGVIDTTHKVIPAKVLLSLLFIAVIYRQFIEWSFYPIIYAGFMGAIIGLFCRYIYFTIIGQKAIAKDYQQWQEQDRFKGPGFDYVKLLAICAIALTYGNFLLFFILSLVTILAWRLLHARSLRIGAIMVFYLVGILLFGAV